MGSVMNYSVMNGSAMIMTMVYYEMVCYDEWSVVKGGLF